MEDLVCVVDDCEDDPVERLTVDAGGLLVVYAICRRHAVEVQNGAKVAQTEGASRGLIGLREAP